MDGNIIELLALNVECMGMVSANKERETAGEALAYTQPWFQEIADKMRKLKQSPTVEKTCPHYFESFDEDLSMMTGRCDCEGKILKEDECE